MDANFQVGVFLGVFEGGNHSLLSAVYIKHHDGQQLRNRHCASSWACRWRASYQSPCAAACAPCPLMKTIPVP